MKKVLALSAALAVAAVVSAAQPANSDAAAATAARASAIDAAELLADVRALSSDAMEGRGFGTPGGARARAYVAGRFKAAGIKPFGASYLQPFKFTPPRETAEREGANVVGYVRGSSRPERFLVVTAHYDHLGIRGGQIYNGADDNASGVAGLLAVARHFARRQPRHSIIFAAFDAEEQGGGGSKKFVAAPPVDLKSVVLNVNLDMIGRSDRGELYAAGARHYPFLKPYVERVAAKSRVRLLQGHDDPALGRNDWTFQSDHGAFHRAGIPFVYFGVEEHADSRAVLVGHSMGTPVVREFYRLRPEKVRALVFVDGALRGFAPKRVVEERVLAPLRAANYRDTVNAMAGGMLGRQMPAPLAEELKSRMASTPQHVVVGAAEGMTDESLWKPDPVRVPVLAVYAKSPAWPADNERFYRSLAADLDYRMWDGVGHFLMLERPREFNDALAGFLRRVNFPEK
ncbi:MAG: alpha/beta fold hydrolase [Acidobacteria bacterium]|nr:alpha/beta fold hydrolase [Acidobacteriota bacterium]